MSDTTVIEGFDPDAPDRNAGHRLTADRDRLARAFARCFAGDDGVRVLAHLRALTRDRVFGPEASDAALRHVEGQRQLVALIESQIARGRSGSKPQDAADDIN